MGERTYFEFVLVFAVCFGQTKKYAEAHLYCEYQKNILHFYMGEVVYGGV